MALQWLAVQIALFFIIGDITEQAVKKELENLQGRWQAVSVEIGGYDCKKIAEVYKLVIKGNRFSLTTANMRYDGTFKIDPTIEPKTIDMTPIAGPFAEKAVLNIYKLERNTLWLCAIPSDQERPAVFATKPDTGQTLAIFKREMPLK